MNLEDAVTSTILPIPASNIAFGKCLPESLKQPQHEIDDCMKPNFPDELRTDEYLFKGIEGLRYDKKRSRKMKLTFHQRNFYCIQ